MIYSPSLGILIVSLIIFAILIVKPSKIPPLKKTSIKSAVPIFTFLFAGVLVAASFIAVVTEGATKHRIERTVALIVKSSEPRDCEFYSADDLKYHCLEMNQLKISRFKDDERINNLKENPPSFWTMTNNHALEISDIYKTTLMALLEDENKMREPSEQMDTSKLEESLKITQEITKQILDNLQNPLVILCAAFFYTLIITLAFFVLAMMLHLLTRLLKAGKKLLSRFLR